MCHPSPPGSHKRSLSLGDKEISRSSPSPALEQPFRDRSNTLSEKPALPVIRDKYKDLTGEVEVSGLRVPGAPRQSTCLGHLGNGGQTVPRHRA